MYTTPASSLTLYIRNIMLRGPSGVLRLIDFDTGRHIRIVELGGLAYVVLHVFWDLVARVDGLHRAFWHAHGAVDAVRRAYHYARGVLRADTRFGYNVGHALPLC